MKALGSFETSGRSTAATEQQNLHQIQHIEIGHDCLLPNPYLITTVIMFTSSRRYLSSAIVNNTANVRIT